MSELATRQYEPLPEAVENLLAHGDLKQLTTAQRIAYYKARCDAAGLDPRGRPFEFIQLNGKLVLYALKECAEQLNGLHGISHAISGTVVDEKTGLIEVTVQASMSGGRTTFDIGVVNAQGLKGDNLANAKMKAVTKAKRRATLSLCGLGDVIDESELDTVSTVRVNESGNAIPADNGTGHGSGKYASAEQVASYLQAMEGYLAKRNLKWMDYWSMRCNGEIPDGCGDLCNRWQADGHLAKWAQESGRLVEGSLPEDGKIKNNQVGRFTAIIYHRSKADQKALATELASYIDRQESIQMEKIKARNPELFADDEVTDDEVMGDAFDEADGRHRAIEGASNG